MSSPHSGWLYRFEGGPVDGKTVGPGGPDRPPDELVAIASDDGGVMCGALDLDEIPPNEVAEIVQLGGGVYLRDPNRTSKLPENEGILVRGAVYVYQGGTAV